MTCLSCSVWLGSQQAYQDVHGAGSMTTTGTEKEIREEYFESHATGVEVETEIRRRLTSRSPGIRRRFGFTRSTIRSANWST